jgi:hypothetical protein
LYYIKQNAYRFGSVLAEFEMGTSDNDVTTADLTNDVTEQLAEMGMDPDPTATTSSCK